MATPRHCRGCGQVHDPLMPCPKVLADLQRIGGFTKRVVLISGTAKPSASGTNQRCPTCKQRIRKPKKRKKAKRA